jgi:hypothetical protein
MEASLGGLLQPLVQTIASISSQFRGPFSFLAIVLLVLLAARLDLHHLLLPDRLLRKIKLHHVDCSLLLINDNILVIWHACCYFLLPYRCLRKPDYVAAQGLLPEAGSATVLDPCRRWASGGH